MGLRQSNDREGYGAPSNAWSSVGKFDLIYPESTVRTERPRVSPYAASFQKATVHQFHGRLTGPIKALKKIIDDWGLDNDIAIAILGYELTERSDFNKLLNGLTTLKSRDKKDRLSYILGIHYGLRSIYRDINSERQWLNAPKDILGNMSPIQAMRDGAMDRLILVKQLVDTITGRK